METVDSLYVHAPFCSRRCYYCDFAVKVGSSSDSDLWSRAIAGELQAIHEEQVFRISSSLKTLYVGGGTPSLLSDDSMVKLAGIVGIERLRRKDLEWTCEANPESFDKDKASAWIRAGVNRISSGLQTFQGPSLRWMGRLHGVKQSHEAVKIAREVGFSNVSVDMIVQNASDDGASADLTFTVGEADLDRAIEVIGEARDLLQYQELLSDPNVVKVSVIGVGMRTHAGVAKKMFETLAEKGINIQVISTSEIKVSVLIAEEYTELALRSLHSAYDLDDE